jgi:hypothetical protein
MAYETESTTCEQLDEPDKIIKRENQLKINVKQYDYQE